MQLPKKMTVDQALAADYGYCKAMAISSRARAGYGAPAVRELQAKFAREWADAARRSYALIVSQGERQ